MKAMRATQLTARETSFGWSDYLTAGLVFLITLGVYVYTLAPSVTTEDSGELITAAVHFGVPHPPGYPLWSICGFLISNFFPWGNVAWRVNLMSAIFGAAANGLLGLLVTHSGRWFLNQIVRGEKGSWSWVPIAAGVSAGLILGFSDVMWGQAVIAEVYTLNALFLIGVVLCFYRWMLEPRRLGWLLATVFVFALGLTNHHTLLFIMPAFLLGVFRRHKGLFWTFFTGINAVSLSAMIVLAWFSGDGHLQAITQRVAGGVLILNGLVAGYFTRRISWSHLGLGFCLGWLVVFCADTLGGGWFKLESTAGWSLCTLWSITAALIANSVLRQRFILSMLSLSWLGLLVYAYMHFASSTNPPMNWGYARAKGGFFHAINRGQYTDSLSIVIKNAIGGVVGLPQPGPAKTPEQKLDYFFEIVQGVKLYYRSLEDNLTLPLCLLALPILIYRKQINRAQQDWLIFLLMAYVQLAFFLTLISPPGNMDKQSLWLGKVFYLQSHCVFVLVIGYGLMAVFLYAREQEPHWPQWTCAGFLLTAWIPLSLNYHESNQRHHWFGWKYGVDMLKPLEKGAVVFGGTDPGRFVPTYAIFCESTQARRWKRDPEFDRSDLYLITQNALADRFYMNYIRDHYDRRWQPQTFNAFERWLGRDRQYPRESLEIPDDQEFDQFFIEYGNQVESARRSHGVEIQGVDGIFFINGLVTRAIFEKNKQKHAFYIEESLPILWTYPYCTPAGLLMKINPEPLKEIPPSAVETDRKFWDRYTKELLADPAFSSDYAAQRAFAKLRTSLANLYAFRQMHAEAEYAYQQALQLDPTSGDTVMHFAGLLMSQQKKEQACAVVQAALIRDPMFKSYTEFLQSVKRMEMFEARQMALRQTLVEQPDNPVGYVNLARSMLEMQDVAGAEKALLEMAQRKVIPTKTVVESMQILLMAQLPEETLRILKTRQKIEPKQATLAYEIGAILAATGQNEEALQQLTLAIKLGGEKILEVARKDHRLDLVRDQPKFRPLLN